MAGDKKVDTITSYDIECPNCKTTKYRNPNMKLMVNVCGHALCQNCIATIFSKESGQCPECEIVLMRSKFRLQVFEDPLVEKEIDIRRRVMRIYNQVEEDFLSTTAYDDYLEDIEHTVYSLTFGINRSETEVKIEAYERQHKESIRKNAGRKSLANAEIDRYIELEKMAAIQRTEEAQAEIEKRRTKKDDRQASLMKDLLSSNGDASLIVKSHVEKLKQEKLEQETEELKVKMVAKSAEFSSGVRIGGAQETGPVGPQTTAKAYKYTPPILPPTLPCLPSYGQLVKGGYMAHVKQSYGWVKAGGYSQTFTAMRALQEFMGGHVLTP